VLAGGDWPGNVRQLRQVVATALTRSMSFDVTGDDLPGGYAAVRGRHLTGLERAERQALIGAARGGLGPRGRSPRPGHLPGNHLYRKLKRFKIDPPPRAGNVPGELVIEEGGR
jgi:transcriptional regulator of acetoin/glycerol metabolism